MKKLLLIFLILVSTCLTSPGQNLKVSNNGRYLEKGGKPFVWIGDTAWELFHRLTREEATEYLTMRAKQGFTVIQAVVLAENDGLRTPNPYGDIPLLDFSPEKPNEKYFEHVDFIVNKAAALGLQIAMLPTWGDKLFSLHPAAGPVVFNAANAATYGAFLGKRYKDKPVIWVLGGDRNVDNVEVLNIWRAMAGGLRKGDGGEHLISYHPRGASSSAYWLHNEPWLDFNMYQSGHEARFNKVYEYAERSYLLHPVKPFVDGEPAYEDIAIRFWDYLDFNTATRVSASVLNANGLIQDTGYFKEGFFTDYDVRVHAYWNFLSGACGYTYGNNAVWQMYKKGGPIAIPALTDWREALDRPGANDMQHVRALFEARPLSKLVPNQSVIYGPNPRDSTHLRAAYAVDGSFAMVYAALGQSIQVVMPVIADPQVVAWWYNPREGKATLIGEMPNTGIRQFTPPNSGIGNDWLLLLDSKKAKYKAPQ